MPVVMRRYTAKWPSASLITFQIKFLLVVSHNRWKVSKRFWQFEIQKHLNLLILTSKNNAIFFLSPRNCTPTILMLVNVNWPSNKLKKCRELNRADNKWIVEDTLPVRVAQCRYHGRRLNWLVLMRLYECRNHLQHLLLPLIFLQIVKKFLMTWSYLQCCKRLKYC